MSVPNNDNTSTSVEVPDIKDFNFDNPETDVQPEKVTPPEPEQPAEIDKSNLPPNKAEGETDAQFQVRQQLKALTKMKNDSTSPEEKSQLQDEIAKMRTNLSTLAKQKQTEEPQDEELLTVKENLLKLGFKTDEDVQATVKALIEEQKVEENTRQHSEAINKFYQANKDVAAEPEAKQLLEQYVLDNFRVDANTPASKLAEWMQTARNVLFPSVDRSASIRSAQDKIDVVNFSGTGSNAKAPTVNDKASNTLKNMGWSDADIAAFG